ncbi:MAG: hypothetical protein ACLKAL_11945 [Alkaliphilus sp.]
MSDIHNIISDYVRLIDVLIEYRTRNNAVIYFENVDKRGRATWNFRPSSFKKVLREIVGEEKELYYLGIFKNLGFLLTDMDRERYTKTQRVSGKLVKTISIYRHTYLALKELIK